MSERRKNERRQVENETHVVTSGKSGAKSSKQSLYYHDVPTELFRRAALRHTVGHKKYSGDITMNLNWREGLDDEFYVMDRYNHLWEHLLDFQDNLNKYDDNLGAIAWCAGFLMEVERIHPKMLRRIIRQSRFHGAGATDYKKHLQKIQRG